MIRSFDGVLEMQDAPRLLSMKFMITYVINNVFGKSKIIKRRSNANDVN